MNAEQMKRRDDIHTCHDQCERIACVQRREIDELKRKLKVAKNALEFYSNAQGKWFGIAETIKATEALKEIE